MKTSNIIAVALAATLYTAGLTSCGDDYDDTSIKNQISSLDKRVAELETKVKADIAGIQAAIATINGNDFVKSIKEVEGGYEITFSKGTVAIVKKLSTVSDPILTVVQDTDGKFYWKSNGEWLLDNGSKVPVSLAPDLKIVAFEGQNYWQVNGEWLLDAEGKKVPAVVSVEPVQFEIKENADGSISFILGEKEYKVPVTAGGLTIVDPMDGIITENVKVTYTVALPAGWSMGDLDVVRADVASTGSAGGVAITRAAPASWAVATRKTATQAEIDVTGTDLTTSEVAELTVTFVKKSGERLTGFTFMTAWASEATAQTITLDGTTTVASAIEGYVATNKICPKLTIAGSTAMTNADWEALRNYKPLTELTFSNTAASAVMPDGALMGHKNLSKVILTSSIFTAISASAFEGCIALTDITGTADIVDINSNAFKGCGKLSTFTTLTNVATVGESAFEGCIAMTTAPVVASGLTAIGKNAFKGCVAMTAVPALSTSVKALPEGVFSGCKGINSAVTLANVETIGANAFYGCTSMTSATFTAAKTIGSSAFYGCNQMTAGTFAVANTLGDAAFGACTGLTKLELGKVTSAGTGVFSRKTESCALTLNGAPIVGDLDEMNLMWFGLYWKSITVQ